MNFEQYWIKNSEHHLDNWITKIDAEPIWMSGWNAGYTQGLKQAKLIQEQKQLNKKL